MIFPDVSIDEWARRFPGLEPQEATCSCGKKGKTVRPVLCKDWVGLAMEPCSRCGDKTPGLVMKARNPAIQAEINALLGR
jgi:hypothetical protein